MNLAEASKWVKTLSWGQPHFLWLLLLIPVLWWWLGRRHGASAVGFSSLSLLADLGKQKGGREGWVANLLLMSALASMTIAAARPRHTDAHSKIHASGIDILMVLDCSSSMLAEDFTIEGQPVNRLEAVKNVTQDFIKSRENDRLGMITFGSKAFVVSPLTLDHDWLLSQLAQRVDIAFDYDGTAIGSAIATASNRLKNRDSKSRIIVLLTDGTSNAGRIQPVTAAEAAQALGIKIYTIGTGTRGVANVPVMGRDRRIQTDMFGRPAYQRVRVEFDEEILQKIAEMTGGKYYRATDSASLKTIYREIDKLEKSEVEVERYENVYERFVPFLWLGGSLALIYAFLRYTLWRRLP